MRFLIDLLRYYDLHPQIDFDRFQRAMSSAVDCDFVQVHYMRDS